MTEKQKVILVNCRTDLEDYTEYNISEGKSLIDTYGAEVIKVFDFSTRRPSSSTYITKGQVLKIQEYLEQETQYGEIEENKKARQESTSVDEEHTKIEKNDQELDYQLKKQKKPRVAFIFWNQVINFRNQRVLEKELKIQILDRTRIILDIFEARASSSEEQLQVKLARERYNRSRIVKAWTHLERQSKMANIGGPGEKQLELDRRTIDQKIKTYEQKLKKVANSRYQQRKNRLEIPMVALVGYTNVGKTTLFNYITSSDDLAEDKLFATLGPHIRRIHLEDPNKPLLISDTVGFIRNFPSLLANAFLSTLEEVKYAALILHIRDIKMPFEERYSQIVLNNIKKICVGDQQDSYKNNKISYTNTNTLINETEIKAVDSENDGQKDIENTEYEKDQNIETEKNDLSLPHLEENEYIENNYTSEEEQSNKKNSGSIFYSDQIPGIPPIWSVWNKWDREIDPKPEVDGFKISAKTGDGIKELLTEIRKFLISRRNN